MQNIPEGIPCRKRVVVNAAYETAKKNENLDGTENVCLHLCRDVML
jgi:hypothetical protein